MANILTLDGNIRTEPLNKVRQQALVPAVVYGHGFASKKIQVPSQAFTKIFRTAGYSSLINIKLAGDETHAVLVREIQQHPLKGTITHVDFFRVNMDEEIEAKVPLNFTGVSPAVKDLGGVFVRNIDELLVKALPIHLPHDIPVDISVLGSFDKVIHVKDITLPESVEVLHEADEVVALVQEPRSEQEIEALSTEVKEDVEAVEGVKKEEPAPEGETAEAKE